MPSNVAVPQLQLEDYRLMEPSPSPPATTRATVDESHPHDPQLERYMRDEDALWRDSTSSSMPSHTRSSGSGSGAHFPNSASATHLPPARSDDDAASRSHSRKRRSTSHRQHRPAGAALAVRPVNVLPSAAPTAAAATSSTKRRSASLTAVPAPSFDWRETKSAEEVDGGKADCSRAALQPRPGSTAGSATARDKRRVPERRPSDGSGDGGCPTAPSSAVSQRRRASLLAPDPRDCVDLHYEEVKGVNGMDAVRGAPPSHTHQQQQQQPCALTDSAQPTHQCPAPSLKDDLAALVIAGSVGPSRSDSRGQVDLVDDGASDLAASAWLHRRQRAAAPARPDIDDEGEEEDDDGGDADAEGVGRDGAVCSGADHSDEDDDDGDDDEDACEFEEEYFYYPTAAEGEQADVVNGTADAMQTPARAASPSSSLPRWVRSIAEETPFTPFALACAASGNNPGGAAAAAAGGAASGDAAATPLVTARSPFLRGQYFGAANAAAAAGAGPMSDQRPAHAVAAAGETDTTSPAPAPRLAVQDLVVALLASPSVCPADAGNTTTPLATVESHSHTGNDVQADGDDDDDDEPLPRQPPTMDATTVEAQRLRERLGQRVRQAQARLSYVDELIARFDVVVAARQSELAVLQEKQSALVQQTESYAARAATATREVRRLRERQHGRDEVRLLRDMMTDKENRLRVAQNHLASLRRLSRQLELLHATAGTSPSAASATVPEETQHEDVESAGGAEGSSKAPVSFDGRDMTESSAPQKPQQQQQQVLPMPCSLSAAAAAAAAATATAAATAPLPTSPVLPPARQAAPRADGDATVASKPVAPVGGGNVEEEAVSAASNAEPSSPAHSDAPSASSTESSVASLGTCDALSDFLEELLGEVEGLAKVCIQLPSAPPAASANLSTRKGRSQLASRQQPAQGGTASARSHPTYSALNRRLNDGNNGFFSFFGGATEAHLDSKPLSTFLASLDRLAQAAWEREEELQLRARELATEDEEESVKARVAAEFATSPAPSLLLPHQPPQQLNGSVKSGSAASAEKTGVTSPLSPGVLPCGEGGEENSLGTGTGGGDAVAAHSPLRIISPPGDCGIGSSDRATRQLFLSSPEHGRRGHGNSPGSRTPTRAARAAVSPSSPPITAGAGGGLSPVQAHGTRATLQHRNRVSAAPCLLLPTLVYAYPRMAAVSQHLDAEQQRIQADYAAAIEAERKTRRQRAVQLRDAYREHVAPVLRRAIDALRQQQSSLAAQLAELGVRAVTVEWEEVVDDADPFSDAALLRGLEEARAAGQRSLRTQRRRGPSRMSVRSSQSPLDGAEADEESWYGGSEDAGVNSASRCTSLMRWENGDGPLQQQQQLQLQRRHSGARAATTATEAQASPPPCRVYHRTLRIATGCAQGQSPVAATGALATSSPSAPPSARGPRDSDRHGRSRTAPQRRHSSGRRSAGERPSPRPRHASATPVAQRQSAATPLPSGPSAPSPASTSKACAALRLCTHTPAKTLLERRETPGWSTGKTTSKGVQPPLHTPPGGEHGAGVTPIAIAAFRRSGGTPRASDAPATRHSTTTTVGSGSGYAGESHSSRTRGRAAAAALASSAGGGLVSAGVSAPSQRPTVHPIIEDRRVLITEDAHHAAGGVTSGHSTLATSTAGGADVWRLPFEPSRNTLADGAVRVAITFAGAEARRRLAAQEQQAAYQREFWLLREELARVDEDVFQLRTRWTELQRTRQTIETEQRAKLAEAEAKVMKCRGFYDSLRRENKEWQDIRDELQRVLRGEER